MIVTVGGKAAREGTRFSHAGAIIEGDRGTHEGKVAALTAAGAGATVAVVAKAGMREVTRAARAMPWPARRKHQSTLRPGPSARHRQRGVIRVRR